MRIVLPTLLLHSGCNACGRAFGVLHAGPRPQITQTRAGPVFAADRAETLPRRHHRQQLLPLMSANKFFNFLFSKQSLRYMCTTHFWGPVSNFGIPIAAMMDLKKDPDLISGPMTGSLIVYSLVFMRYSMAVTPQNYLLFGCHFVNELAQLAQGFRWTKHHYQKPAVEAAV